MKTLSQFLIEAKHPIFSGLKLPGGKEARFNHDKGEYYWQKRGGYIHSSRKSAVVSAEASGWNPGSITPTGNADGSQMGHDTMFHKGEHQLKISSSIGHTKSDNWHTITVKKHK